MPEPTTSEISALVREFIARERADKVGQGFDAKTDLIETGILDSLFLMQLVAFLEGEFDLVLSPDSITPDHFTSLATIVSLVQAQRGG